MEKELREKYRKWAKIHVTSIHMDSIEKLIFQFFNEINLLESYHKLQKYNDLRDENERLKNLSKSLLERSYIITGYSKNKYPLHSEQKEMKEYLKTLEKNNKN